MKRLVSLLVFALLAAAPAVVDASPIFHYSVVGVFSDSAADVPGYVAPNGQIAYDFFLDQAAAIQIDANRIDFAGVAVNYYLNGVRSTETAYVAMYRSALVGLIGFGPGQLNLNLSSDTFTGLSSSPTLLTGVFPFGSGGFFGDNQFAGTLTVTAVPEPATLLLLGTGLGAVAARRRLKKKSA